MVQTNVTSLIISESFRLCRWFHSQAITHHYNRRKYCTQSCLHLMGCCWSTGLNSHPIFFILRSHGWNLRHDSLERMCTLRDSLHHLKKGSITIVEYAHKFKRICDQLTVIEHPLDDDDKSHWFLCGLGSSFKIFSTIQLLTTLWPNFHDHVSQANSHELFL